jgi:protease YdgD
MSSISDPVESPPGSARTIAQPLSWMAAIGRLDDVDASTTCSATLVAPDLIVTAAHCLFAEGRTIDPASFVFRPNLGAEPLPTAHGRLVVAVGSDRINALRLQDMPSPADWALIRITPSIGEVQPLAIENLKVSDIERRLASGARLSLAGYGADGLSAGSRLSQHLSCRLTTGDDMPGDSMDLILVSDCRISKGDSGGPMILTETDGRHYLVGVISGYGLTERDARRISFGAAAAAFAAKVPANP